ncbi:DUF4330 family protein [Halococcus morrhuae DSM 1307]|uniref:DUF4330 family protein n=1 Tax=Halococcus morrhuae TaxID=2250 RepID=UPI001266F5DE|nr:DUF4330 family protein [Halococcus morrhuae]
MKVIDDKGRLFGIVNVIDAVGIVLIIALIVSAGAVVIATSSTDDGSQNSANESGNATENTAPMMNQTTSMVRFQLIDDAPYVVNGIDKGPVPSNEDIVSVLGSSQTTPVPTGTNNTTSNASLRLRVNVTTQQGTAHFKDERLYIGSQFRLDLGNVVVDAIVTDFEVNNRTAVAGQKLT